MSFDTAQQASTTPLSSKRSASSRPTSLVTSRDSPAPGEAKNTSGEPEVESPSLSTPQARARFEFEPGKSNDGTKILMVEWEDDDSTQSMRGAWTVSWEGKSHVLPAEERNAKDATAQTQVPAHRLFFLLPPGVSVPATVTLTLKPEDSSIGPVVWKTNPLPAIFPPGLYEPAVGSRRPSKGVLHTMWAKKRLSTLQQEIEREEKQFPEGVGLEMAMKEKEWIETSFGVTPSEIGTATHRLSFKGLSDAPLSPSTPLSPGGSRLAEKLKGLKIQTAEENLRPGSGASKNPLSPDDADIAVPSYSAFRGANPDVLAAKPPQVPSNATAEAQAPPPPPPTVRKPVPQAPARPLGGPMSSLAGMMAGTGPGFAAVVPGRQDEPEDEERGLFALPLSPRSPEMTKSPFSFERGDTMKYLKGDQAQRVA